MMGGKGSNVHDNGALWRVGGCLALCLLCGCENEMPESVPIPDDATVAIYWVTLTQENTGPLVLVPQQDEPPVVSLEFYMARVTVQSEEGFAEQVDQPRAEITLVGAIQLGLETLEDRTYTVRDVAPDMGSFEYLLSLEGQGVRIEGAPVLGRVYDDDRCVLIEIAVLAVALRLVHRDEEEYTCGEPP